MNKSVILFFVASTFAMVSFSEANMMGNYKIALVDQHFQWVNEQGAVVTLKELEKKLDIPADLNLPTTQEEMDKFYEIYSKTSPTQLSYCTNFWLIQKKNVLELFFNCTSVTAISLWLQTVREFVNLIKQNKNLLFKMRILKSYFSIWAEAIKEIESSTNTQTILLPIQELKNGLRALLDELNQKQQLVKGINL